MKIKTMFFSSILAAGLCCSAMGFHAAAYTLQDVIDKAHSVGVPESTIQQGINMWDTGEYDQADIDTAWYALDDYNSTVQDKIDDLFGGGSSSPSEGTSSAVDSAGDTTSSSGGTVSSGSSGVTSGVTSSDFINMTLEEKIAYVNGMDPAGRQAFLDGLSNAERNSIIKQMSIKDKTDILEDYMQVADAMGMHMVVDSISEDGIGVTVRDKNGVIVDKTAMGITIDETGISHTKLLVTAAAAFTLAASGLIWLYRCLSRKEKGVE